MLTGPAATRAPHAMNRGGTYSAACINISTPSDCFDRLSSAVVWRTSSTQSSGFSAPTGRRRIQVETRLPMEPLSSGSLMLTGAPTRKSIVLGFAPRRNRYCRTAPVTAASTTSFTVHSNSRRMALTSASGTVSQSIRRWGPRVPFSGVSEERLSANPTTSPTARARASRPSQPGAPLSPTTPSPRNAFQGISAKREAASNRSSPSVGDGRGT